MIGTNILTISKVPYYNIYRRYTQFRALFERLIEIDKRQVVFLIKLINFNKEY